MLVINARDRRTSFLDRSLVLKGRLPGFFQVRLNFLFLILKTFFPKLCCWSVAEALPPGRASYQTPEI